MTVSRRKPSALRVLCVDDDELMLDFTSMILTDFEFDLLSFNRSTAALRYLKAQGDVDVVISDVMMPEMTGPDLFVACYRHSPELASRFLFVSADLNNARRLVDAAARQVGVLRPPSLLGKQFSKEALLEAVAAVAARVPARSQPGASSSRISDVPLRDSRF